MKKTILIAAIASTLVSCGKKLNSTTDSVVGKAAWNHTNAPAKLIVGKFEAKIDEKLEGLQILSTYKNDTLWSGDYWATYKGGISYRWKTDTSKYNLISNTDSLTGQEIDTLSPAEKYDLYLGATNFPLTSYEKKRTIEAGRNDIPTWEGICHAWAPATLKYKNPSPVTVKSLDGKHDINFSSGDVKALLSSYVHYAQAKNSYFLGNRCNKKFSTSSKFFSKIFPKVNSEDACQGVNPGSFHIVLTNEIGKNDRGFVFDRTRDQEVWNQGVIGYKMKKVGKAKKIKTAKTKFGKAFLKFGRKLRKKLKNRVDAKGTVKRQRYSTTVYYISEITPTDERVSIQDSGVESVTYDYTLEIDANNNVVGGEWNSSERPDFLWNIVIPDFNEAGSPIQNYFSDLKSIYNQSIL